MKALIVGYYNHNNFGDDMYMLSFPSVLNKANLEFVRVDDIEQKDWRDYDLVILGGGDIMCPYFLDKFKKWYHKVQPQIPCHAYSFGLPFPSILREGHLDIFDYLICRNKDDTELLKERFGKDYVEYLPDFVFNEIISNTRLTPSQRGTKPIVSIFPANQCIHGNTMNKLASFIEQYKDFYTFISYPMDTNPNNQSNDYKISLQLQQYAPSLQIHQGPYNFNALTQLMHQSYFAICNRLHSHIFAIMTGTPFISLYSTRKVRNLLDDFNLNELGTSLYLKCEYCKQTNQPPKSQSLVLSTNNKLPGCPACQQMCGKPVDLNFDDILKLHQNVIKNHRQISQHLLTISINNRYLLNSSSDRLPLLVKRSTPPIYIDSLTIEDKKRGLTKEILSYMNKSIDHDNPLLDQKIEEETDCLLKGQKSFEDLYKEKSKKDFNDQDLKNLELELADLISYKLSGKVRPDFHYGLSEKIVQKDYNLNESLDYLIKHQFQNHCPQDKFINKNSKFNMHKINQEKLENIHYSGWNYVVNYLYMQMHNPDGVMLNAFIDRTFHWEYNFNLKMGIIPYQEPWVGFLHHALDEDYSDYNCKVLFEKEAFIESLKHCKGIYVFSKYLKNWVQETLRKKKVFHVRVENLIHPTKIPQIKFNYYKFRNNRYKSIIQIGGWYRNSYAIYDLNTRLHKIALKGSGNENYFKPKDFDFDDILEIGSPVECPCPGPCGHTMGCGHTCGSDHQNGTAPYKNNKYMIGMIQMLKEKDNSVKVFENVDNLSYDQLLSQNIVFLNLVDCSVSNTVVECIVRNTPLLINRHPAVVELLGRRYPFYYSTMEEATRKSNDLYLIQLTHFYLRSLNKSHYTMGYFIRSLQRSKIHRDIRLPSQRRNINLKIEDLENESHGCDSENESPILFEV